MSTARIRLRRPVAIPSHPFSSCFVLGSLLLLCGPSFLSQAVHVKPLEAKNLPEPSIELIQPDARGGKAYKLVYYVPVPRAIYWRFKTDFDNSFVEETSSSRSTAFCAAKETW